MKMTVVLGYCTDDIEVYSFIAHVEAETVAQAEQKAIQKAIKEDGPSSSEDDYQLVAAFAGHIDAL